MKTVSVNYWLIFDGDNDIAEDSPPQPRPVSKDFLNKVKASQGKIVVCASDNDEAKQLEGRSPEFQEMFIKSCMEEALKKGDMPFDSVALGRPQYSDFHISSDIVKYKNWQEVLIKKLRGKGGG